MKHHSSIQLDQMLQGVIRQAKEAGIPVSGKIQPQVRINHRAKSRMGCCKKGKSGGFEIEISDFVLEGETDVIQTILAHEVLHTCPGCMNHGMQWKGYGKIMEDLHGYRIARLASPGELNLPRKKKLPAFKYLLSCADCGRKTYRQRMSPVVKRPDLYRCTCGGRLTLTVMERKNPQDLHSRHI